jgi:hypothetical protein|tara:strand:+ start:28 stop:144 length:117 start_codon:yes stop_codon:yes gene_type:complete
MMTVNGFIAITAVLACIMFIGYMEDPCITEGLAQGCMK